MANTIISLVGEPIFALGVGTIIAIYGLVRTEDNKKVIGIMETARSHTHLIDEREETQLCAAFVILETVR